MKSIKITPTLISPRNFSECGQLITAPERIPDMQKEGVRFWDEVVNCEIEGEPDIAFLELRRRAFRVSQMERHLTHNQGFIPLNGAKLLFVAAPPTDIDQPEMSAIKAYMIDGSCGIMIHKGTWHDILYPLDPLARIITILREGTSRDDMYIVNLVERFGTEIQIDHGNGSYKSD